MSVENQVKSTDRNNNSDIKKSRNLSQDGLVPSQFESSPRMETELNDAKDAQDLKNQIDAVDPESMIGKALTILRCN